MCQEKFQQNDTIRMQSCLHKFHDACLMECYTRYIEELISSSDIYPNFPLDTNTQFVSCVAVVFGNGAHYFSVIKGFVDDTWTVKDALVQEFRTHKDFDAAAKSAYSATATCSCCGCRRFHQCNRACACVVIFHS